MKSKLFYTMSLVIILAALAAAAPKMNVPLNVIDFGYAPQKSAVTCRFWIFSTGADTLRIIDVKPGCGCTKAPLEKNRIAPGDSTFVDITFNTGQYKGKVTKTVNITAADSVQAQRVTILANVLPSPDSATILKIEPSILDLSGTQQKHEISFDIENKTGNEIIPQLVSTPGSDFEIKLPGKIKAGQKAQAKIKLLTEAIPPGYAKSFTFAIDDAQQTRFTVPIKGEAALSSTPPQKH
jgi:hypothetical protein